MSLEFEQADIEQKQKLLTQRRRNLNHLKQQAAQYGPQEFVPLSIHNALTAEQSEIARLERELATLNASPQPRPQWQALVIDPDSHWREIIAKNVGQLGGAVIEHHIFAMPESTEEIIATSAVAIVGLPHQLETDGATGQWIENVVKLGHRLPIILLVCWDNKDAAISLRRAFGQGQTDMMPVTIFKENFDPAWFSRVVHRILTH
jgi:hypothetical protein